MSRSRRSRRARRQAARKPASSTLSEHSMTVPTAESNVPMSLAVEPPVQAGQLEPDKMR